MRADWMTLDKWAGASPRLLPRSLVNRVRDDSLLRNSIYMMAATVIMSASGYVYWTLAAHMYSAHDVGLASALIGGMLLAATLSNQGIGSALVQILPHREAGHPWSLTVNAALALSTFTALATGGIAAVALPLFSPQFAMVGHQAIYTIALISGVLLETLPGLLDKTFVAERAAGSMCLRVTAFSLLRIPLLVLPLLLVQAGAGAIFSSWVLADAISLIGGVLLLVPRLNRAYRLAVRGILGQARSMLSSITGHHFINMGAIAPMYLLPVFVTARLSASENAYFYTTWMLGNIFFMVSPAVANSLFAEGSHAPNDMLRKARSSALIIAALMSPAMLVALLGGHFILSVFGPSYAQHGQFLLIILVASAVPDAITNVYVSTLRVRRRLGLAALLNLGMAALALALTWVLLPILGIAGAGWAWLIAQTAGTLVVGAHAIATGIGLRLTVWRGHMK